MSQFRPKTLAGLIGQKKLVRKIRNHFKSGRPPKAWMFIGETGSGKTTMARILALALQCRHQEVFGNPCRECRRHAKHFDITEINAGDITGINELRSALSGSDYVPGPGSRKRVYILDEAQGLSKAAQTLMLKYLEDCPSSTVWFICTTDPHKILATIQRRCTLYTMPKLNYKAVRLLVRKVIRFEGSDYDSEPLADALNEKGITSGGLVVAAVKKYCTGSSPEEAVQVRADTDVDTHNMCRAVVKGDWEGVAKLLREAAPEEATVIQSSVGGYLKSILLDEELGNRSKALAKCIDKLAYLNAKTDKLALAGLASALHELCLYFKNAQR